MVSVVGSVVLVVVEPDTLGRVQVTLYRMCRMAFWSPSNSNMSAKGLVWLFTFSTSTPALESRDSPSTSARKESGISATSKVPLYPPLAAVTKYAILSA